jgi:hypothetical protein
LKGKFVADEIGDAQRVFVFAGSNSSFLETITEVSLELERADLFFIWVIREENWRDVEAHPHPFIVLPPDYKENPMTDDYRFRLLVSTGHI